MALNKKIHNIVIGIDTKNNQLKILRNMGKDHKKLSIEHLSYEPDLYKTNQIFELLDRLLSYHLANNPLGPNDAYIVLPDHFVFTQIIVLPSMPTAKSNATLKAEIARIMPKNQKYGTTVTQISKTKTNAVFSVRFVLEEVLDDCVRACKKNGLNLRGISYSANCLLNSFLALGTQSKNQDLMFLDIKEKSSTLVCQLGGKNAMFFTLPIGQNFLSSEQKNYLSEFIKARHAQKDVFNSAGSTAYNITFAGKTVAEIENNAFKHFKNTYQSTLQNAEDFVAKESAKTSALSINFDVLKRYVWQAHDYLKELNLPAPTTTVVNIPKSFGNALMGGAGDIVFSPLKQHLAEKCLITDYLDLYGALFMGSFNKSHNFDLKKSFIKKKTQKVT